MTILIGAILGAVAGIALALMVVIPNRRGLVRGDTGDALLRGVLFGGIVGAVIGLFL